jgi:hypothetical protein
MPYFEPSRPMPLSFMPPKGAISVEMMPSRIARPLGATSRSRHRLQSRRARPSLLRSPLAEIRRSRQRCFGLGNEPAHNLAYRQDFSNASGGLARPEQTLVLTT